MKTIQSKVKNLSFDIEPKQYGKYNVTAYLNGDKENDINVIARVRLNTQKDIKDIESLLCAEDWTKDINYIAISKKHYAIYREIANKYN